MDEDFKKSPLAPFFQTDRVPYVGGLDTRRERMTGAIEALAYPTPTLSPPPEETVS